VSFGMAGNLAVIADFLQGRRRFSCEFAKKVLVQARSCWKLVRDTRRLRRARFPPRGILSPP